MDFKFEVNRIPITWINPLVEDTLGSWRQFWHFETVFETYSGTIPGTWRQYDSWRHTTYSVTFCTHGENPVFGENVGTWRLCPHLETHQQLETHLQLIKKCLQEVFVYKCPIVSKWGLSRIFRPSRPNSFTNNIMKGNEWVRSLR